MADFSPTGYWAHYTTQFSKPDPVNPFGRALGHRWASVYPVVGYTDTALIIDEYGTVKTVGAFLDELREGGDTPDEEGETFTVSLSVENGPGEEGE